MAKFKVGDMVRYVNPETARLHHNYAGYRGVVERVSEGCYWFDSGGGVEIFSADEIKDKFELELVTPAPSAASPIREVTKRELVDGRYGIINVDGEWIHVRSNTHGPADLRAAAKTLIEIADYFESQSATESAH